MCKKCFDVGPQEFGAARSYLKEFHVWRGMIKGNKNNNRNLNVSIQPVNNVEEELQRLVDGYKKHIGSSKIKSLVTEAFSFVKIPDWQKSKRWMVRKKNQ